MSVKSVGIPGLFGLTDAKPIFKDEGILLGKASVINVIGNAINAVLESGVLTLTCNISEKYKGIYANLAALESAHPTANSGDYALVDSGEESNALAYFWDADDGWVTNDNYVSLTDTDALTEGSSNLYFTSARAISAVTSTINAAVASALEPTINPQTGTSYIIGTVGTDNNGKTILHMDNAAANTPILTSAQTLPISICQFGEGVTTITAGAGVTSLTGNLVFSTRYQTKTIYRVSAGVYNVVG